MIEIILDILHLKISWKLHLISYASNITKIINGNNYLIYEPLLTIHELDNY